VTQSIIKWRTDWRDRIRRVECAKETKCSVWLLTDLWQKDGRHLPQPERENKLSQTHAYHDTWEEAHAFLLQREEDAVKAARRQLELTNSRYENIKGMKKPAEVEP
jgi:hypothetical protein